MSTTTTPECTTTKDFRHNLFEAIRQIINVYDFGIQCTELSANTPEQRVRAVQLSTDIRHAIENIWRSFYPPHASFKARLAAANLDVAKPTAHQFRAWLDIVIADIYIGARRINYPQIMAELTTLSTHVSEQSTTRLLLKEIITTYNSQLSPSKRRGRAKATAATMREQSFESDQQVGYEEDDTEIYTNSA